MTIITIIVVLSPIGNLPHEHDNEDHAPKINFSNHFKKFLQPSQWSLFLGSETVCLGPEAEFLGP